MATATPFPTILRRGRRVRVTVQRQEPLFAIVEAGRGTEPEVTHIVPRRQAMAYKRSARRLRLFGLGVRIRIVPIRWTLDEASDLPQTLGMQFGIGKAVQS